jgi:diguanylate cyclase (GGDEF)-like protein
MTTTVRPSDGIGRYGGEEFLLVLPDCDAHGAAGIGERLRENIDEDPLVLAEGIIPITLSLGVATIDIAQDMKTLIAAADAALYRAKGNGRNRVELATMHVVMATTSGG